MSVIVDGLEDKCRRIAHEMKELSSGAMPATFVGREIALALDHMDAIRGRQRALLERLHEREVHIDTQIMNIDDHIGLLPDWLERTRLENEFTQRLDQIENHTQRALTDSDSALRQLQVRLMELLNMHEQLSFEYGDTEDTT
jgi:hypothetical protein